MLGLPQLRVFWAVVRTGSFTKAAEGLGVTPPAVSVQIRRLERQCGTRLFERVGRRVRLTPPGEMLRPYVQNIFTLAEDAERALQGAEFHATRLRIAATPTTAGYYFAAFWNRVRRRYPHLQLDLSIHNSRGVTERILALEDDLGMLGGDVDHPDIVLQPFGRDPVVAVVPSGHPLAKQRRVTLHALGKEVLILREPGSATRTLLERRLREAGIETHATLELASTEAIKQAVEAGAGVGVLGAAVVRRDVRGGYLRAIRVSDPRFVMTLSLAYRRDRGDSPLLRAILQTTRSASMRDRRG
jgi:DNA-binding transcriptional LysR family regulator